MSESDLVARTRQLLAEAEKRRRDSYVVAMACPTCANNAELLSVIPALLADNERLTADAKALRVKLEDAKVTAGEALLKLDAAEARIAQLTEKVRQWHDDFGARADGGPTTLAWVVADLDMLLDLGITLFTASVVSGDTPKQAGEGE